MTVISENTLNTIQRWTRKLKEYSPISYQWEIKLILKKVTSRGLLDFYNDVEISLSEKELIDSYIVRRTNGEPLAYILGEVDFMGLNLSVGPGVLIPRIETELLVKSVLEKLKNSFFDSTSRALDLGAGSCNIPVGLVNFSENILVDAVENSPQALYYSKKNVRLHGKDRVNLIEMDYLNEDWDKKLESKYQFIISNPPYIANSEFDTLPSEVRKEPKKALLAGFYGTEYIKEIMKKSFSFLDSKGYLLMEVGVGQYNALDAFINSSKEWALEKIILDHQDIQRVIILKKR